MKMIIEGSNRFRKFEKIEFVSAFILQNKNQGKCVSWSKYKHYTREEILLKKDKNE